LKTDKSIDDQHCGTKPKKIAFGIAPLGIISIGIVPMGIVSIGIVPMGVFSFGAVAMGIINISIVGMGIISSGITTMGVLEFSPKTSGHNHSVENKSLKNTSPHLKHQKILFKTKKEAESMAEILNCNGAHKMGDMWMPCNSHR
tara:strand:+ start:610 stop:1041 length:432 start_codon:yes stop_codon:yes gene_type:complete